MKTTKNANNRQSKQANANKPRPEIRDDLDSRERLEGKERHDIEKKGEKLKKKTKKELVKH